MQITRKSQFSGITRTVELNVTPEQIALWEGGVLIQNAMPQLSQSEREFLITGITDDEWQRMFGSEDEDDDTDPVEAIGESRFGLPGGGGLGER